MLQQIKLSLTGILTSLMIVFSIFLLIFLILKPHSTKIFPSKTESERTTAGNSNIQTFFTSTTRSSSLTDIDLQNIASNQIVLDFRTNFTTAQLERLRQLNPEIKVLRYVNAGHVSSDWYGGAYNYIETNHPNWFLLDRKGQRVTRATNPDMYVLDPGNKGYQSWVADRALKKVANDYDGILADAFYYAFTADYYSAPPINPTTGKEYTLNEWTQAKEQLLSKIKEKLGEKILVANGYGTGERYFRYGARSFLGVTNGVMFEGFLRWGRDPINSYRSETQWRKDIDALQEVSKSGKIVLIETSFVAGTEDTPEAENYKEYSLASFLLGNNSNSFYDLQTVDPERDIGFDSLFHPLYKAKIGSPLGSYYKRDKIYQRDFSNGKVLVNPTGNSYAVDLQRTYRTLGGKKVSRVRMEPHTGMILLNAQWK